MDFENDYIEPESAYTLKDGKAAVKIQFSMEAIKAMGMMDKMIPQIKETKWKTK